MVGAMGQAAHMRHAHLRNRGASVGYQNLSVGAGGYANLSVGAAQALQGSVPGQGAGWQMSDNAPLNVRQWPFGIASLAMGTATSATTSITAQIVFTPVRLMLFETAAGDTTISTLVIGQRPQQVSTQYAIPSRVFQNTATDSLVSFDTATTGQSLILTVNNVSGSTTTFTGGVIAVCAPNQ